MKNRQNTQKQSMPANQALELTNGAALTSEFSLLFGSSAFAKFSAWLMEKSGTYLFSVALILNLIKFGFSVYNYVQTRNKNLAEKAGLGWALLQILLIGTAISGALIAAATFVLVTPILFTLSMSLDSIRNMGLFFWNLARLAMLRYSVNDELNEPLVEAMYEKQKDVYVENLKRYGVGSLISLLLTAATVLVFLLPHAGAAAAAFAATTFSILSFKTSIAGFFGFLAASAMVSDFVLPPVIIGAKKIAGYLKSLAVKAYPLVVTPVVNAVRKGFSFLVAKLFTTDEEQVKEEKVVRQPLLRQSGELVLERIAPVLNPAKPKYVIREEDLDRALNTKLKHNGFFTHSHFREVIVDRIDDKDMAKRAIISMAQTKIAAIQAQVNKGESNQNAKRLEKIKALQLVRDYLTDPSMSFRDEKNATVMQFENAKGVILFINKNLPEVDVSFFRTESDTRNVVKALTYYYRKFEEVSELNPSLQLSA